MKFGLFGNQYYTPDGKFAATDLYDQAELMEEVGFDSFALGERHVHEEGFVEPVTALSGIGARTDTLELTTTAMLPILYHPLHLAEQIAMLDRLSEGRVSFGAALGYRDRELKPFGIEKEGRSKTFIEAIELLKRLWSEGHVTHDGLTWSLENVCVSPQPAGDLPLWIGGHADVAIKRAAYRGDGWIASASSTTEDLKSQIEVYENSLDEFGKERSENDVVLMRDCYVAESFEEARETIEPHLLKLYRMYARWGQTYVDEHEVEIEYDELEEKFIIGPPEDCIEKLYEYADLGVDHLVLRCQFPGQSQKSTLRCIERIGDELIPEFN